MLDLLFSYINSIMPKNKKQIYIASTVAYKDNMSAILDELLRHKECQEYRIILDGIELRNYNEKNMIHVKHRTFKSIWMFLRSKYVLIDNGIYGSIYVRNQITVNTWHGMGLKKIGFYSNPRKKIYRTATHVIAYSPYFCSTMSYAFGIPENDVIITCDPRNDFFYIPSESLSKISINKAYYKKVIIWMPTYRKSNFAVSPDDGMDYEFGIPLINSNNLELLDNELKKCNIFMIIKYHSLQNVNMPKSNFSNILFLSSEQVYKAGISVQNIIYECDALITDYSSVYINYLTLNRPICFAFDDYNVYANKRGFMFDNIYDMMPGFKANTFVELLSFIKKLSEDKDEYEEARIKANSVFNYYNDNMNSLRILQKIGIIKS